MENCENSESRLKQIDALKAVWTYVLKGNKVKRKGYCLAVALVIYFSIFLVDPTLLGLRLPEDWIIAFSCYAIFARMIFINMEQIVKFDQRENKEDKDLIIFGLKYSYWFAVTFGLLIAVILKMVG